MVDRDYHSGEVPEYKYLRFLNQLDFLSETYKLPPHSYTLKWLDTIAQYKIVVNTFFLIQNAL